MLSSTTDHASTKLPQNLNLPQAALWGIHIIEPTWEKKQKVDEKVCLVEKELFFLKIHVFIYI